ncbi:MAG: phosphoribosyl-ATP diphosphatase [Rhizobiaceae bacterium]|nr:phosphoribosyl-ATP diphosphatase [Rhizobiaceae bacterium]
MNAFSLTDLQQIIDSRTRSSAEVSYTSTLLTDGTAKCAQKVGEEAVETVIAAVAGDKTGLRNEAADLLYHLLVLLKSEGVLLEDVMSELSRRTRQSGLQEKADR